MEEPRIAGVPVVLLRQRPVGVIDVDLYCMHCGYNLRGLSGDPVRCPECGKHNERGELVVPAAMITRALREMETAPSLAVGCFVLIQVFVVPAFFGFYALIPLGLLTFIAWYAFVRWTARVFEHEPGWTRTLIDFHVAMVLFTSFIPLAALAARIPRLPGWGSIPVAAALFLVGLRIYQKARARLARNQREAAVRIACALTRTMMRRGR